MLRMPSLRADSRAWIAPSLFVACVAVVASCATRASDDREEPRGHALFSRHCSACHGERGDGDTPVKPLLFPRPRAFRDGVFKLASSQNGVPTELDLVATLRRGLPGSSMPSYGWMSGDDLAALAQRVRSLAVDGMRERIQLRAASLGIVATDEQAQREAERRMQPGEKVVVPPPMQDTEANRAQGEALYRRHCAACHGEDGKGRTPEIAWAGAAEMQWPRDFTAGFLRGDATRDAIAHRIRAGIPGAGMPPTDLSDVETALLVDHVKSRIVDGSEGKHVQWRRTFRAVRVADIPNDPDDLTWTDVESVRIPLAPLWWRKEAVFEVRVRAVHDDHRLVFQLQWDDATCDDRAMLGSPQGDGAALQLTSEAEPPMFAMGGSEGVEIWHWKSFRSDEVAGGLDLLSRVGHDATDAPWVIPGVTQPMRTGEALPVHGPIGMTTSRGLGRPIVATPRWRDGVWTLVLSRGLRARKTDELAIEPTQKMFVAFAVWDGSIDLHAASKSVSTWHALELAR